MKNAVKRAMRNPRFRSETGRLLCTLLITVLGSALPAQAAPLEQQVTRYLKKEVGRYARTVGSQDVTIQLKSLPGDNDCDHPLQMSLNNPEQPVGRVGVSITCQRPQFWKARAYADVDVYLKLVTTTRLLNRDTPITARDLTRTRTSLRHLRQGYFIQAKAVIGQHSRRKIQPGTVLTPRMIEPAELIARDDVVTIVAKQPGFKASMKGIALENGHQGEKIWVRNLSSGKKVMARIESPHTVVTQF